MIPLDFNMILTSVVMSLMLGVISAPVYLVFKAFIYCFSSIGTVGNVKRERFFSVLRNTGNFIFVLAIGLLQIIINYVTLDGVFSGYSLLAMIIAFYFTSYFTEKPFDMVYRKLKARVNNHRYSK